VREQEILPHVAAVAILLAAPALARGNRRQVGLTGAAGTAALIDALRADGVVLTHDPDGRTLRVGDHDRLSVTIGKNR
jgi:hypothetical protein